MLIADCCIAIMHSALFFIFVMHELLLVLHLDHLFSEQTIRYKRYWFLFIGASVQLIIIRLVYSCANLCFYIYTVGSSEQKLAIVSLVCFIFIGQFESFFCNKCALIVFIQSLVQKEPMHILRVAASSTGWCP